MRYFLAALLAVALLAPRAPADLNTSASGTAQLGTWTVQPGNTPNTSAWLMQLNGSSNAPVAATAATVVKATAGTVRRLIVGTGVASATVKLFDLASASCTGSPSGAKVTLTLPSTLANPFVIDVNSSFTSGICVQDSSASLLLTVVYD